MPDSPPTDGRPGAPSGVLPRASGPEPPGVSPGGPSGILRTALSLAVAGGLVLAHLEVLSRGPAYAGPLLALDHLFDAGLALLVLALSASLGWRLLRLMALEPADAVERLLHSTAVGAGAWSLLFLFLGAAGLLSGWWIGGALAVGSVLARRETVGIPSAVADAIGEARERAGDGWLPGLAVVVTLGVAAFLLINGSAPPGDWDSLMYHLEIPRQWLDAGRIFLPPDNLHAAYIGVVQLLYLPFLAVGSPAAAALLNGAFALLLGLAVFDAGSRLFDATTGTLSTVLVWTCTGLLIVAVTARVDTTLAFYLFLGQTALVSALGGERSESRAHLFRGALVLGIAAGISVAVALPWMIKNQLLLGAPLYPFFTHRIIEPWLAKLYGSNLVPASVGPAVYGSLGRARQPFDLLTLFLAPQKLTVEPEAVHYHLDPLFLLLPLWLFHLRNRKAGALILPPLLYVVGLVLFRPATNLRYLFPALAPMTVATTFLAVASARRLLSARAARGALGLLAVAALGPTAWSCVAWTETTPALKEVAGAISRQDYLAGGYSFYASIVGAINRTVPPDGRVLLLWEARGFYLAPPHLQDNVLTNWPFLEPWLEQRGTCLEGTGITHVLASTGAAGYYVSRGADPSVLGLDRFGAFARRCLVPVVRGAGFTLYRARTAGPA